MEQFFESIETAEQHIQILRIGDIFDITESYRHVFYIDSGIVVSFTKLLRLFCINELCIDNSIFSFSPLKKLEVFLVFCLVVKVDLVLFDFLVCEIVAKQIGKAMFWAVIATSRRNEVPVLVFK
jgi:hypothetical protein